MFDLGYMTRWVEGDSKEIDPSKVAIQMEDQHYWTYRSLHLQSNKYANALKQLGVQKGDRVGILLYNCLEYFGLYFAIAKIGAVAVRLNFRLSSPEFEYILKDSGAKVLCFHSDLQESIGNIKDTIPVEHFICIDEEANGTPVWSDSIKILESGSIDNIQPDGIKMEDPVMLMYTSGTTGLPKGSLWTHGNTFWFSAMQAMKWNFTGQEIAMTTGPLYHVGAMEDIAMPVILRGGTVHITKSKRFDINRVLNVMSKYKITDCFLFPFMIYEMLNSPKIAAFPLESIKRIYTGGDPIMPKAIEELNARFPHVGLVQVYGLTEGTPIAASLDPKDNKNKHHTVGKPLPLTEIKITDETGRRLPIGEVGEISIKSPVVSLKYWNKPDATQDTFKDGWCKTGDLGVFDEDGFLSIAGRKKDMIRSGGENVYAAEIEDLLYRHEGIQEVSIIGLPDPKYIEKVCAVVVKKRNSEFSEQEVLEYLEGKIANYKKPKKVIFVDELPRTPSGKVQKFKLREQYH